jgi:hypothetical protein
MIIQLQNQQTIRNITMMMMMMMIIQHQNQQVVQNMTMMMIIHLHQQKQLHIRNTITMMMMIIIQIPLKRIIIHHHIPVLHLDFDRKMTTFLQQKVAQIIPIDFTKLQTMTVKIIICDIFFVEFYN